MNSASDCGFLIIVEELGPYSAYSCPFILLISEALTVFLKCSEPMGFKMIDDLLSGYKHLLL